ncbi:MAG: DUF1552 domain-containing protein [Planctomycetota bacterium]
MTMSLNRRTLLRGAGAIMGLPFLESMSSASEIASSPRRMAMIFFPNGAIMPSWKPEVAGDPIDTRDWKLSPTLMPLSKHREKINVIGNLAHDNGRSHRDGAGDHARCASTYLTAARPVKTSGNIRLGISVDQVAAEQIGNKTRLPSIELGLEPSRSGGSCDSGYSCAYSSNISWRDERRPMPKEITPRAAFDRMFGGGQDSERERDFLRRSILDVVSYDAKRLIGKVGPTDRRKLDEYFTSVREIEQRIARSEELDRQAMPDIEVPYGRVETFREHVRLMYDLLTIAFESDVTRVATFMLDNAGGNRRYTEIGVKEAHHQMSHHRNREDTVAKIQQVDHYLVEHFSYFLDQLEAKKDVAGRSLLDQSMILYGSGISDGNRHRHDDLPLVLAGGAGGAWQTGRHIRPRDETPMGNLFLSMLDAMDTPADSIGDSSGRLNIL